MTSTRRLRKLQVTAVTAIVRAHGRSLGSPRLQRARPEQSPPFAVVRGGTVPNDPALILSARSYFTEPQGDAGGDLV
jgi:hypothetical protein